MKVTVRKLIENNTTQTMVRLFMDVVMRPQMFI